MSDKIDKIQQHHILCKRCLSSELPDGQYHKTIYEYIASMPEDDKAAPDEFRRRLAICKECDELVNGICRQCGCFVEARAAKKSKTCAMYPKNWSGSI
jgi:hypothetical protein